MLLNRASPWLDIDSYLPYEGKVVIKNKKARKLSVRIPQWVDKKSVQSLLGKSGNKKQGMKNEKTFWVGQYLVFDNLKPNDLITITFPMVESVEIYTLKWKVEDFWFESTYPGDTWKPKKNPDKFTMHFKGNTLVDISPRSHVKGYHLYQRDYLKRDKAPMKKVTRFTSPERIKW